MHRANLEQQEHEGQLEDEGRDAGHDAQARILRPQQSPQ